MTETTNQAPTEDIREALKDVIDPELGVNVVDLGLLYGLHYADDGALLVDMTLTTAACPPTGASRPSSAATRPPWCRSRGRPGPRFRP